MDLCDFDFQKRCVNINVNLHLFARWHHIYLKDLCCFAPVSVCVGGLFFNDNICLKKIGFKQVLTLDTQYAIDSIRV